MQGQPAPRPPADQIDDYVRMARAQRHAGRARLALDILETARRLLPADALVLCEIARTHTAMGATDHALAVYELIARDHADCADAHWERGVLLEARGQIDEAMAAWRLSGLNANPGRHSLYVAVALKSQRSTNESLLTLQQEWAAAHARSSPHTPRPASPQSQRRR